jgi:rod shape-determining protein MreD
VSSSYTSKLWLAAALFAQTVFAPWLTIHGALPSFAVIVVVLYALRVGVRGALLLGALAGIVTDILSGTGGGWTVAYLAIAAASGAVRARFFADGIVLPSLLIAAAVLVRNTIFWIVMTAEGYPRGYGTVHLHAAIEQAILTGLAAAAIAALRTRFAGDAGDGLQRYA